MEQAKSIMMRAFPKSTPITERCKRLQDLLLPDDSLAIIINADPDAIASALALKRLYWHKVKKTLIFHINPIKRADNLALVKLLRIDLRPLTKLKQNQFTKTAMVDSQPHHNVLFEKYHFDVIIDHHPAGPLSEAPFVDIKEEYGAVSTLMTEYLRAAKIKPSPKLATALLYGIKTDTDNFARHATTQDINAFRYLYSFANINIIKKIESSELNRKTLQSIRRAIDNLRFHKDIAFIHMESISNPDDLVIITDFFLKMVEASWCIVSGVYGKNLIVIMRYAGFRLDAGKTAEKLFGPWGNAGGHKEAARAEIPLQALTKYAKGESGLRQFVWEKIVSL
jgi:nanoRNase/pAp phosphatase (c-di-AMP/oligoRNAs hydrolase)